MDGRCRSIRVSCGSLAFRDRAQACFVPSTAIAPLTPGEVQVHLGWAADRRAQRR